MNVQNRITNDVVTAGCHVDLTLTSHSYSGQAHRVGILLSRRSAAAEIYSTVPSPSDIARAEGILVPESGAATYAVVEPTHCHKPFHHESPPNEP